MKIALYNHTGEVSGAEVNLLMTAAYMSRVEPILFAPEGELLRRAGDAGLATVPLRSARARLSRNPIMLARDAGRMLGAGWRFAREVKKHSVDAVHANSVRAGLMASLFRWHHRLPVIWHLHDMPPKGPVGWLIKLVALAAARSLIAISRPVADGMELAGLRSRIRLVHNGTVVQETSAADKQRRRKHIREELQTPENGFVFAIVGQIARWKRQEDAILAAAVLIEQGHDIYLWVVGEPKFRSENGRYWEELKAMAAERNLEGRIRFTGFHDQVDDICCAADSLLLCSENEPFGRVIIEAMAQGTPVIATDGGGVPDIIEHGITGLLYETGNIDELVYYACELLEDPLFRRTLGERGKERVRTAFSIEQAASKVEAVYEESCLQQLEAALGSDVPEAERARGIAK
ncbi:glycosyltransferase family 4 protein [Paenibacillus sp. NPDC058071]|uniref:glycosyltransferase family 4 protein n=1 Tax=Paenibacillus sp. NPDC058071 TaxID=3346326 RepID=UPI0036DF6102